MGLACMLRISRPGTLTQLYATVPIGGSEPAHATEFEMENDPWLQASGMEQRRRRPRQWGRRRRFWLILGVVVTDPVLGPVGLRRQLERLAMHGWVRSGLSSAPAWASRCPARGMAVLSVSPFSKTDVLTSVMRRTLTSLQSCWPGFQICSARFVDPESRVSISVDLT